MSIKSGVVKVFSIIAILAMTFSNLQPASVQAQGGDGIRRQVNAESGKVSFIGPASGRSLSAAKALGTSIRPQDPAMAFAQRFAPEFGLKNPEGNLSEMKNEHSDDGRRTVRYQQNYQGIPVMGGELIINTNERGDLYSINGEVSPDLSLPTQPTINSAQAREMALQAVSKWYEKTPADFVTTEPELWIYDESLLQPSTRPVELVWRMDVTLKETGMPVRELVLVNAERGSISLHFNQVDNTWATGEITGTTPNYTPEPVETSVTDFIPAVVEVEDNQIREAVFGLEKNGLNTDELAGVTWYVATTGNDSNTCATANLPCATINAAINKATNGDTIRVALGTYTGSGSQVVLINKNLTIVGGWDSNFFTQIGYSVIDGQNARLGVYSNNTNNVTGSIISYFKIQNSMTGIYVGYFENLSISNSLIYNNISDGHGGGIFNEGTLLLNNSSIYGNYAGYMGGGVYNIGRVTVNNTTISHNTAYYGGGLYSGSGPAFLNNTTISDNMSSALGGGVYHGGNFVTKNSIIARNSSSWLGPDCYSFSAPITSNDYNLISNTSSCPINTANAGHDKLNVDSGLGIFLPTLGYTPLAENSPAIDSGNPAVPGTGGNACLSLDQRGVTRPLDGPDSDNIAVCDIGAFEYSTPGNVSKIIYDNGSPQVVAPNSQLPTPLRIIAVDNLGTPKPNIVVTFTAPSSGASGKFDTTQTNISTVFTDVNGLATSPGFISNGIVGEYNIIASVEGIIETVRFSITNGFWFVDLNGSNLNNCTSPNLACATIQGVLAKPYFMGGNTINVKEGIYNTPDSISIKNNITIKGGWNSSFTNQTGTSIIEDTIEIYIGTTATIEKLTIRNNHIGGVPGIGNSGTLTIQNSSIINNDQGIYNIGTLTILNSTISGNGKTSDLNAGGGLQNDDPNARVTIINSAIVDNHSYGGAGGIHNDSSAAGVVFLKNSLIAGNTTVYGRGTDCEGGDYGDAPMYRGKIFSLGHNIIGSIGLYNGAEYPCRADWLRTDLVGDETNPVNPQIDALTNVGSNVWVHPLRLGSPAIDSVLSNDCPSADQRRISRPQGGYCDVGPYEFMFDHDVNNLLITTYNAGNSATLPGTLVCNQTDPACSSGDSHAKAAHKYAIGTYNLYKNKYNRISIDNAGIEINSTVHYKSGYDNAFWNGHMMIYGDAHGYPLADDIVAHELTHGVTQYESNLFYYYQSGAINESFSDLWGEYYDQTNAQGNDAAGVKWRIGEDVNGWANPLPLPAVGLRDMSNPTLFRDPDKMTSIDYYEGADDNGGVHRNSGLNNKAIYLMVDGGTFNNKTVTALSWDKTAAIYYEVNINLLSSGADYSDLYYALQQACTNLIGQKGITAGDCTEVKDAIDAVEMNVQRVPSFNMDAPLCTVNTPIIAFVDDLEDGTGNWTFDNGFYTRWQYDSPYGPFTQSGDHSLYADDYPETSTDAKATLASFIVPNNAYLHFAHAYDFEQNAIAYYDGGVLEYRMDGSTNWVDASSLMDSNVYNGKISNGYSNPLSGRSAFVGSSHGYSSTRLNLSSLAGQAVSFRWRLGLDNYGSAAGWWVDNIKVYTCGPATTFADVFNAYWAWSFIERLYSAGITGGCGTSPLQYCPETTVTRSQMAVFLLRGIHGSSYSPPGLGAGTGFGDVPVDYWSAVWIKQLAAEGITGGCGSGNYCPEYPVTRDQMAVFLLRSKYGSSYSPPAVGTSTGFGDVPTDHWAAPWIKQLVTEGITAGCGSGNYCPNLPVTRAQMAVFLVRTFNLP